MPDPSIASLEHIVVYRDQSYYAGWPFNGGFWQFADGELAVGFVRSRCDYQSAGCVNHGHVDREQGEHVIVRSRDGGRTWPGESMTSVYTRPEFDETLKSAVVAGDPQHTLDPAADGFCLLSGFGIPPLDAPHLAWVMTSTDRGRSWHEPVLLPQANRDDAGFSFLGGRPSYLLRDDGMLLLFVHGGRAADKSGARPLVYASPTGGTYWAPLSEVEMTPALPKGIMPYPLQLSDGTILIAVRREYGGGNAYTQIYASSDGGRSFHYRSRVNDWGAPANLTPLPDGRLLCVYGYRQPPYGIRARVSHDTGHTWSGELIVRDDGGSGDLGYPRTILRPDGSLVTVYYFNCKDDPCQHNGGVRHIAATLWRV